MMAMKEQRGLIKMKESRRGDYNEGVTKGDYIE